jgi:nicotinate-nucleotide adenylyltransferase
VSVIGISIRPGCCVARPIPARDCAWFRRQPVFPFMLCAVRRGILGGTFDPFHVVHLMAGEAARHMLDLDVVTYITAGDPYQKHGIPMSDKDRRWAMTVLGIEGIGYFEADDREVKRTGPSYMIDTLDTFDDDEDIYLILGADAAVGLPSWHRWRDVVERTTVTVISRPGVAEEEVAATGAPYTWLDTPGIPISSTMLRARAEAGGSIRFFVPDPVWRYVEENRLYELP